MLSCGRLQMVVAQNAAVVAWSLGMNESSWLEVLVWAFPVLNEHSIAFKGELRVGLWHFTLAVGFLASRESRRPPVGYA